MKVNLNPDGTVSLTWDPMKDALALVVHRHDAEKGTFNTYKIGGGLDVLVIDTKVQPPLVLGMIKSLDTETGEMERLDPRGQMVTSTETGMVLGLSFQEEETLPDDSYMPSQKCGRGPRTTWIGSAD